MSNFSEALRTVLNVHNLPASRLSRLAGLDPSAITHMLRGRITPRPETLSRVLGGLPPDERAHLIAARLRDEMPPGYEDLLFIAPTDEVGRLEEMAGTYALPDYVAADLREALDYLAAEAVRLQEVRQLILELAAALGAERKNP